MNYKAIESEANEWGIQVIPRHYPEAITFFSPRENRGFTMFKLNLTWSVVYKNHENLSVKMSGGKAKMASLCLSLAVDGV
jgi:hypothetical protein